MKKLLVDTSIWIEYFKGNETVIDIIHDQNNFEVFITGPVLTELIQGIKTQNEKDRFAMCINAVPKLPITDDDWINAGNTGNSLRKIGVTIPLPDLIILTVANKSKCALFTRDKHFKIIKESIRVDIELL